MDTPPILELASLPERYDTGDALLTLFGAQVVIRLGYDPMRVEGGALRRLVRVDYKPVASDAAPRAFDCWIGWSGAACYTDDYLEQVALTKNQIDITEDAAIGVAALLAHAFAGVTRLRVEQIG